MRRGSACGKPIPFEARRTFGACAFDSRPLLQVSGVLGRLAALPGRKPGALRSIGGSNPSTPTIVWSSTSLIARMSVMRPRGGSKCAAVA